jgi:hypothetical protein
VQHETKFADKELQEKQKVFLLDYMKVVLRIKHEKKLYYQPHLEIIYVYVSIIHRKPNFEL